MTLLGICSVAGEMKRDRSSKLVDIYLNSALEIWQYALKMKSALEMELCVIISEIRLLNWRLKCGKCLKSNQNCLINFSKEMSIVKVHLNVKQGSSKQLTSFSWKSQSLRFLSVCYLSSFKYWHWLYLFFHIHQQNVDIICSVNFWTLGILFIRKCWQLLLKMSPCI